MAYFILGVTVPGAILDWKTGMKVLTEGLVIMQEPGFLGTNTEEILWW